MRALVLWLTLGLLVAATQEQASRDAAMWPFADTSPWNMALGDKAAYQPIASPRFNVGKGGSLNATGFSHPVYIAALGDPMVAIYRKGTAAPIATVRVPADAKPDSRGDGHLHIIDEMHRSVVEMWQAVRNPDGSVTATAVMRNDLSDEGVYPAWHGVRAYGGSAIAGLIRAGELNRGIRHALAIAVEQQSLNRNAPGGKGWVWPASSCDNHNAYGSTGNLFMGSLLAIPPEVDVRRSGLRGGALEMAIALQDYGAYITDCTGSNLSFYAEPAAADEAAKVDNGEVGKLVAMLQVVANNGPQAVGGGGAKRRRPSAPPFAAIVPGARPGTEPAITAEPAATTVQAGQPLRLVVTATGSAPLTYRWRRGASAVGGNTADLALAAAKASDAGSYTCTVSNPFGRAVSAAAEVVVEGGAVVEAKGPVRPPAEVLKLWTERLRVAVRAGIASRRAPQYRSALLHATVTIEGMAEDGLMTVAMASGGTLQVPWAQLRDDELASLAQDAARGTSPAEHALAGFFLLLAGDAAAARLRLAQAGDQAAVVESAFAGG